ncbi:MAG: hypothetical protein GKR87_08380 [Kiritimatiellae bacterium]|nr:hypothetical protein [Kiritimatiellia bacterium]
MTLNEMIEIAGNNPAILLLIFALFPGTVLVLPMLHRRTIMAVSPWRYVYTVIIYLVAFPGMLSIVLIAYALFFTKSNLMNVNMLVYFLPILSMVVTLVLMKKNISFDHIPGFDRIYGLATIIAMTFVFVLIIEKTRIWLFFGGSIFFLVTIIIFLFGLLKWGSHMLFRGKNESKRNPPSFPYQ